MIPTMLHGSEVFVWTAAPDWSAPFQLSLSLESRMTQSLGGIESRRSRGEVLKASGRFAIKLLDKADARRTRLGLLALGGEAVLFPVWPWDAKISESVISATFASCLCLTYEPDWSTFEAHLLSAPPSGYSADARTVPVVVGYFAKEFRPSALTDEHLVGREVSFSESGADAYSLDPLPFTLPTGLTTPAGVRPLFPLPPDFREPEIGGAQTDIVRTGDDGSRNLVTVYFPQTPRRPGVFSCWFRDKSDWRAMASLLVQMQGNVGTFWVANRLTETPLSASVSAGATSVTVDLPAMLDNGGRALALIKAGSFGGTMEVRLLTNSGALANPLTFAGGLTNSFAPATTVVSSLLLARLKTPVLNFTFGTDSLGRVSVDFIEVPTEYGAQADETISATMGALAAEAVIVDLTVDEGGVETVYRFADFGSDIYVDGSLYRGNRVVVEALTKSVNAGSDNLSLALTIPTGASAAPFDELFPYEIEGKLTILVRRAVLSSGGRDFSLDFWTDFG